MAKLNESVAALRIFGDALDPEEISRILGCAPSKAYVKGQVEPSKYKDVVRKSGAWMLDAAPQKPASLDAQVKELFKRVNSDIAVWAELASEYGIDLFCGFFMNEGDEGLDVSPETMKILGDRGIKLGICIYAPSKEDTESPA